MDVSVVHSLITFGFYTTVTDDKHADSSQRDHLSKCQFFVLNKKM